MDKTGQQQTIKKGKRIALALLLFLTMLLKHICDLMMTILSFSIFLFEQTYRHPWKAILLVEIVIVCKLRLGLEATQVFPEKAGFFKSEALLYCMIDDRILQQDCQDILVTTAISKWFTPKQFGAIQPPNWYASVLIDINNLMEFCQPLPAFFSLVQTVLQCILILTKKVFVAFSTLLALLTTVLSVSILLRRNECNCDQDQLISCQNQTLQTQIADLVQQIEAFKVKEVVWVKSSKQQQEFYRNNSVSLVSIESSELLKLQKENFELKNFTVKLQEAIQTHPQQLSQLVNSHIQEIDQLKANQEQELQQKETEIKQLTQKFQDLQAAPTSLLQVTRFFKDGFSLIEHNYLHDLCVPVFKEKYNADGDAFNKLMTIQDKQSIDQINLYYEDLGKLM